MKSISWTLGKYSWYFKRGWAQQTTALFKSIFKRMYITRFLLRFISLLKIGLMNHLCVYTLQIFYGYCRFIMNCMKCLKRTFWCETIYLWFVMCEVWKLSGARISIRTSGNDRSESLKSTCFKYGQYSLLK